MASVNKVKSSGNVGNGWGDFQLVSDVMPQRMIFRSFGPEKVGKNHFGLSGPGPIAVQSFDIGLEGVAEKFRKQGKEVRSTTYEFVKDKCDQDDAIEIRDRFIKDYEIALNKARTIQWDTETELWEIFRFAEFGKASDAPKDYVKLNARYRDLIQQAYDANVNLQLIQKVKEKWGTIKKQSRDGRIVDSPYPTGEMEPTGFKEAGYIVQVNIKHTWDKENGFGINILNCRQNMGVAGETFYDMSFGELAQLVFPGTDDEDWA
jgi:hypothetical protein